MTMKTYLLILSHFFAKLLPSALLCYMPMKNQLRFPARMILLIALAVIFPYCFLAAWLCWLFRLEINAILLPSLVFFLWGYHATVKTSFSCSMAVFFGVCAWMTFPSQYMAAYEGWLYPQLSSLDFSAEGAVVHLGAACLLTVMLAYPCRRWYSRFIDNLNYGKVWYAVFILYFLFMVFNIQMIPHSYQVLHTGRVFPMFLALETTAMMFLFVLHIIFYHIATMILENAKLTERSHVLEMQADQYRSLQNYMLQSSRLRHDFRHSIHILSTLADKGDLEGLRLYLREYSQPLEAENPVNYCFNAALNALFNYYHEMAVAAEVKTSWHLSIPEPLTVSELDMASLFGNLMENAIAGCQTLPKEQRFFNLSAEIRQNNHLYIVSTNSFDGQAKKVGEHYVSTKHKGHGTGLFSIAAIAEKYDGYVKIHHQGNQFLVDIVIKI